MSVPIDQTLLFAIPLELRQLIYKEALASPLQGTDLLRTCREIHSEAHKYLFERPLNFRSQLNLFDWLDQVTPEYLSQAKWVSLNLQDADLRSLLTASDLINHPGDPPRLLTWTLYETELERLERALRRLPNVRRIEIRAISGRQSFLYREFLRRFLRLLASLYPDIVGLGLQGNLHHQDLCFLASFGKLKSFSFDGFSASSPAETASILAGLNDLTSLSLISQSTMLTLEPRSHKDTMVNLPSFTGGVAKSMDNLTCLSVIETVLPTAPTLFFTPEVLDSLHNYQALNTVKLCVSQTPNDNTMAALEDFLDNSRIKMLELDWPDLDHHVLKTYSLVPDCLEEFWVRAKGAADACGIISSIAESRTAGNVRPLRDLVLVRSTRDYGVVSPSVNERKDSGIAEYGGDYDVMPADCDDRAAVDVSRAQAHLQALGVRVLWCTERL